MNYTVSRTKPLLPSFFDDFFMRDRMEPQVQSNRKLRPAVNILDQENQYRLDLIAPGLEKSDFIINLEEELLTISFAKKEENEEGAEKYSRKEFHQADFSRSFRLPEEGIEADKIEASYKAGVLSVSVPKVAVEPKTELRKQIEIK